MEKCCILSDKQKQQIFKSLLIKINNNFTNSPRYIFVIYLIGDIIL